MPNWFCRLFGLLTDAELKLQTINTLKDLPNPVDGVDVYNHIQRATGKNVTMARVYSMLCGLVTEGIVKSEPKVVEAKRTGYSLPSKSGGKVEQNQATKPGEGAALD